MHQGRPTKYNKKEDRLSIKPFVCVKGITWKDVSMVDIRHVLHEHARKCSLVQMFWNWITYWSINCSKDKMHTYVGGNSSSQAASNCCWNGRMFHQHELWLLREKDDG
jgi:hypothetical protein